MALTEKALVDVYFVSGSDPPRTCAIAYSWPVAMLTRICGRFAKAMEHGAVDVEKRTGRRMWHIRDRTGVVSIKAMRIVFIWLSGYYVSGAPGEMRTTRIPIDLGEEKWGATGTAAMRQALRFLELQGELKDQNHLKAPIRAYLLARRYSDWDDVVFVWLCLAEEDELRQLFIEEVTAYVNDSRQREWSSAHIKNLTSAIDGYHGKAEDLKTAYEAETRYQRVQGYRSPIEMRSRHEQSRKRAQGPRSLTPSPSSELDHPASFRESRSRSGSRHRDALRTYDNGPRPSNAGSEKIERARKQNRQTLSRNHRPSRDEPTALGYDREHGLRYDQEHDPRYTLHETSQEGNEPYARAHRRHDRQHGAPHDRRLERPYDARHQPWYGDQNVPLHYDGSNDDGRFDDSHPHPPESSSRRHTHGQGSSQESEGRDVPTFLPHQNVAGSTEGGDRMDNFRRQQSSFTSGSEEGEWLEREHSSQSRSSAHAQVSPSASNANATPLGLRGGGRTAFRRR